MNMKHETQVQIIPIDKITIVNGRKRGQTKFRQIVSNISHIGLKKPITVARRTGKSGEVSYDLVCGQGRLEAFVALGQKEVPAMVIDANEEELMLMSLAENMARRQRTSIEMAREIVALHDRGNSIQEIARRVDLDQTYVRGIVRLLKNGEERLLRAVEQRQVPLSMAIEIAESDDHEIQRLMTEAYEKKELTGRSLLAVRKLLDQRRSKGKALYTRIRNGAALSSGDLLKVYKKETARLQMLVNRANQSETSIRFVVTAFKTLMADEQFASLLKSESLNSMPRYLSDHVLGKETSHVRKG
jgi:ParB family chromosome partitioning protein